MTQLVGGWEEEKLAQGLARAGSAYLSGVEGGCCVLLGCGLMRLFIG